MEVSLIAYTPEPERTVAAAARLCYSSQDPHKLLDGMNEEKAVALVSKLTAMGHFSPFEHVSFTFAINGISRATSHQLVRHRIASYSQRSQRYVGEENFDYVIPPSIARNEVLRDKYETLMAEIAQVYAQLASSVPAEDARYVLPNACETAIVCTFNTRSLYNLLAHRLCLRAQWEIRNVAEKMLEQVRAVAPTLFAEAGASCETTGICPEGSYSCGRIESIKNRNGAES
ncbi:FAD-dependent thymidylate synthase [Heliorestis acidaminivorans]|uniref:Flavin-dependent thymidylate synthase n=1 Tax=Heliorestis acidaminivorans TaxID=553427 RepID=A0A6I0EWF6_9FIRM|nr:FAD-dependent thymidylate synthase [Heliorestis acidaminivorans]KAB2951433.1 FAD-dependent thymidylate synthase [Heliorestis acidaminivorans]